LKVDKSTAPEPELSLQPREKVLWESEGGPNRVDPIAWAFSLFWSLVFVLIAAVLFTVFLEQIPRTGFTGMSALILICLFVSLAILAFLARHIYGEATRETKMNYAITNQRLVVATKSGDHHNSFTGRPFSTLELKKRGDAHDITLTGLNADDPDEVVLQLLSVTDGEKAEKLLLKSFMQKAGGKK
jgi:hypothetical protein